MGGSLVPDLGISPFNWLILSWLAVVILFFKFNRLVSVRNLDLCLLFILSPGLMQLVSEPDAQRAWGAYVWLLAGSGLLLARCLVDLGLPRRPVLEPNLNTPGLFTLTVALLALLMAETIELPLAHGARRNPAERPERIDEARRGPTVVEAVEETLDSVPAGLPKHLPLPSLPERFREDRLREWVSRGLAMGSHLTIVGGLWWLGHRLHGRREIGLAMAACYLLLPYTRVALVDSGQLVASALIVAAIVARDRPWICGLLITTAAAWIPACVGLVPIWALRTRDRATLKFLASASVVVASSLMVQTLLPEATSWARALGARSFKEAGLQLSDLEFNFTSPPEDPPSPQPGVPSQPAANSTPVTSLWSGLEPSYRIPVLTLALAFVMLVSFWPAQKTPAELIAVSCATLITSQFWYLDHGGTLVALYLPLLLILIFRPSRTSPLRRVSPTRGRPHALPPASSLKTNSDTASIASSSSGLSRGG
ncbi:hypothetical protein Isop_0356 [Isosphaera pallida ATCC 43644]|uniref:Uncharacterized protein n=1 Tax=Isosphaera pallida (strain ATCC 43644 / DSM 9630 / IS1B) TaxID=575540 RepID=E8QXX2_ISOPI|nr:hypothetical protein [Isosphaera pallida]ADV60951.1 hypothetical protein Isop_0356 [Isosphaera pallida ATCC 43644]